MDTMPNYGIVGALLLTISIPSVFSPPTFGFNGDGEASSKENPSVQFFVHKTLLIFSLIIFQVILMNISTAASMALVWLSAAIIQQYRNAYSQELKTEFSVRFGQIVTVMTGLLVMSSSSLFVALFVALAASYTLVTSLISIVILCVGFIGMVKIVFPFSLSYLMNLDLFESLYHFTQFGDVCAAYG